MRKHWKRPGNCQRGVDMESRTEIQDTATANIRELLIHLSKQPKTSIAPFNYLGKNEKSFASHRPTTWPNWVDIRIWKTWMPICKTASASHQRKMSMVLSRSAMATSAVNAGCGCLQKHQSFIVTSQSSFQEQDVSFTNRSAVEGVFSECTIKIIEGCTFNVFLNPATSEDQVRVSTPAKNDV